jgi:hypothetical protein
MRVSSSINLSSFAGPRTLVGMALLSLLMTLTFLPTSQAHGPITTTVCPFNNGGTLMPAGATYTDSYGNTWVAPSGFEGRGLLFDSFGNMSSYFFPGSQSSVPLPMIQGFGGVFGNYDGQQGWIVTDYCQTTVPV